MRKNDIRASGQVLRTHPQNAIQRTGGARIATRAKVDRRRRLSSSLVLKCISGAGVGSKGRERMRRKLTGTAASHQAEVGVGETCTNIMSAECGPCKRGISAGQSRPPSAHTLPSEGAAERGRARQSARKARRGAEPCGRLLHARCLARHGNDTESASQRHAGRTLTHLLGVQVNAAIGGVDELGEVADVLRTAQSQRVTAQLFHTQPCVGEDPSCRAHAAEPSRRPRGSPGTCCVEDLCCSARRCRRYRKGVRLLWSRTKCEESQSIHPKLDYSGIVAIVQVLVVPD